MKNCKKCEIEKADSEYYLMNKKRGYVDTVCKECRRAEAKAYRKETAEDKRRREETRVYKTRDPNYRRKYYEEKREEHLSRAKKRYESNREEAIAYSKEYAKRNPEKVAEIKRRHYEENKEDYLFRAYKRKMAIRESYFLISDKQLTELVGRFEGKCVLTGSKEIHMDHFIPISTGHGETSVRNLIPLQNSLNLSKSDKNPFVWAETLMPEQRNNFNKVVEYLAEINGLTVVEYREFVFWCFENKREVDEITDENRDSLAYWMRTKNAA